MKRLILVSVVVVTFLLSLSASTAWTSPCCDGDYNCDNKVNFQDYIAFVGDFIRGLLKIAPSGICGNVNISKTGQTESYAAGDDGDFEKGVALPNPRFTDNGDGTVTDNLTGLIWLKDANCFDIRTWDQALSDCSGLASGACGLTDGSQAGDWRLPNLFELESLRDMTYYDPALSDTARTGKWTDGDPFYGVQPFYYWSSTTFAGRTDVAWYMIMYSGVVDGGIKSYTLYVWPVRGGY